jgi:hypothetical protein
MRIKFTLKRSCDDELEATGILAAKRHNHNASPGLCSRWNKAVRNIVQLPKLHFVTSFFKEDERLRSAIEACGTNDWIRVATMMSSTGRCVRNSVGLFSITDQAYKLFIVG